MKKLKTIALLFIVGFTMLFITPVIPVSTSNVQAATIKLNKKKASIEVGKTIKLKVKGTKKKVKWSSSKKSVATVSKKGVVKGRKKGKATITAKVAGKKFKCKITVKKPSPTKALMTFISKKGKTDSHGDKYISATSGFDTTKYEWRIVNEGDRLNFIFTSEGTIIGTVTSMRIVDLAKNPYIDPERTNYNKESDDEFTVTAHILAKDFSKDSNVSFTAISNSKKSMDSNFQQAANIELRFAFQGWEDLLKTQANMTLASIGFTSYK